MSSTPADARPADSPTVPGLVAAVYFDDDGVALRPRWRELTPDELDDFNARAADSPAPPIPDDPPPPFPELVGAALDALDPSTATVADVLDALRPLFPSPPNREGG